MPYLLLMSNIRVVCVLPAVSLQDIILSRI